MFSRLFAVACVLTFGISLVQGDEVNGKVKKIDSDKNTITITVDDKDQTFNTTKDTKVVALYGKNLKKAQQQDVPGGLTAVKEGAGVTLTTEKKDDKDVVVQLKLDELQKGKKKKTTN